MNFCDCCSAHTCDFDRYLLGAHNSKAADRIQDSIYCFKNFHEINIYGRQHQSSQFNSMCSIGFPQTLCYSLFIVFCISPYILSQRCHNFCTYGLSLNYFLLLWFQLFFKVVKCFLHSVKPWCTGFLFPFCLPLLI